MAGDHAIVLTTAGDLTEAHRLATALVERRLAACVQISQISSVYRWEGAVAAEPETRLVIKTRRDRVDAVSAALAELHSYDTPQIVTLDVAGGSEAYLSWIDEAVRPGAEA